MYLPPIPYAMSGTDVECVATEYAMSDAEVAYAVRKERARVFGVCLLSGDTACAYNPPGTDVGMLLPAVPTALSGTRPAPLALHLPRRVGSARSLARSLAHSRDAMGCPIQT
eukprot:3083374-Rhodomonas_salina.4